MRPGALTPALTRRVSAALTPALTRRVSAALTQRCGAPAAVAPVAPAAQRLASRHCVAAEPALRGSAVRWTACRLRRRALSVSAVANAVPPPAAGAAASAFKRTERISDMKVRVVARLWPGALPWRPRGGRKHSPNLWRMRRRPPAQAGPDGGLSRVGQTVTVRGWVRTVREQKTFAFIEVRKRRARLSAA